MECSKTDSKLCLSFKAVIGFLNLPLIPVAVFLYSPNVSISTNSNLSAIDLALPILR